LEIADGAVLRRDAVVLLAQAALEGEQIAGGGDDRHKGRQRTCGDKAA